MEEKFHELRGRATQERQVGLTNLYSLIHNPEDHSLDIEQLRNLYSQTNQGVLSAYGWKDLSKEPHGFFETPSGIRFTLKPAATAEMLDRLLELNHERYAEEVKQGLHAPSGKGKKPKGKGSAQAETKRATKPKKGTKSSTSDLF
ncbi:hypothetical protein [Archangium violaceum]|uniref:hypothetical protein n=1 Tax=Archangium violaceum TaxID=83451 RepID=UPI0036DECC87